MNDSNVTPIQAVNTYGTDDRAAIEDFPLKIKNSPTIMVHEPDAGTVMDIEEAGSTRAVLRLFLGTDFDKIEEHLNAVQPDVLVDIAGDLSRHFKLSATQAKVNRADRRRAARGR